jgi:hypothetical protein
VRFHDERAVVNAGVLLPAVLADRLGMDGLVGRTVDPGDRGRGEPDTRSGVVGWRGPPRKGAARDLERLSELTQPCQERLARS